MLDRIQLLLLRLQRRGLTSHIETCDREIAEWESGRSYHRWVDAANLKVHFMTRRDEVDDAIYVILQRRAARLSSMARKNGFDLWVSMRPTGSLPSDGGKPAWPSTINGQDVA